MRIASLSPAVTEILYALERQKFIVCVDKFSDWPEAARTLPHVPEHQKVDSDALRAFDPLLVFTQTLVQAKLAERLKSEGFAVIHQDPRSLADINESIRQIGMLLDCTPRAEALIQSMQQGFNETKRKASLLPRRPRVYVEEWHHPPMVSGNWVPEVVRIAGGVSLPLDPGAPSREVCLDEIQAFDPDLIVLSICGAGAVASTDLLLSRPGWAELRAARERHVFVMDDSLLNRPGPRLVIGAQRIFGWCFQVLH